jgi:hypothetical protein
MWLKPRSDLLIWNTIRKYKAAEEDEASCGGQFDDRPSYFVKMPHQRNQSRMDSPFDAVRTRELVDDIMKNRFHTANDLQVWARRCTRLGTIASRN